MCLYFLKLIIDIPEIFIFGSQKLSLKDLGSSVL